MIFTGHIECLQADGLLAALLWSGVGREIADAQPARWEAWTRLTREHARSRDRADQEKEMRALGYFLALCAVADTPNALDRMFERMRDELTVYLVPLAAELLREREAGHGQA